ncbi:MAG: hypothetical protein JW765_04760 [Deltaproteobacteria bacterium]|nr:hypothetical protein [Candidatus Zymogenaceae bacterium]
MNLPKVMLPPALSLLFLIVIIYGMGSCMAAIPQAYRVNGPWVIETTPEREIVVEETGSDSPTTISLFSWGALFSQADREIGALRYERVNYTLRDSHNLPIWTITSHDTYVLVADPQGKELFRIVSRTNDVEFIDPQGKLISSIVISGDGASLFSADGTFLAATVTTPLGMELCTPRGTVMRVSNSSVSPAGLVAAALPSFDRLERAALIIMVK